MFKRLFSSALVFGMSAMAPPALAASCAPREGLVQQLQASFSESLSSAGLQNSQPFDTMIEIWSSADSGTFTVLVTYPSGISCIVASGQNYFKVTKSGSEPGVPS
ncbi:hypothetical protein [Pseudophaeobacter flagellatus]|uniref:hypothetical protein n=1 Tax=Pseudophaeobacter flagellatus TaxID=2899119 RepID=UPI001E4E5365|nr:hypothetical protein [Pseudophaeobacter flagellatus]MCD9147084.1 hypothetical protein [Pseudophaeobacter flagellatus]